MTKERVTEKTPAHACVFGIPLNHLMLHMVLPVSSVMDKTLFHWACLVVFDDGDEEHADEREVRLCELGVKDTGKEKIIVPSYTSFANFRELRELMVAQEWLVVEEFSVPDLSPAELFAHVQDVSLNGHVYDPVGENCQRWVKELTECMGYTMQANDLGEAGGWGYCLTSLAIQPALKCAAIKIDKKKKF
jgi:hypothetical protein